jgi:hypothetical protein
MFVPPVWNPNQNFPHSEWMHWRWAGATCVDYHNTVVVATINMVEIGNLRVSGDALNPLLNLSERKPVIMTLPIPFGNHQISITRLDKRTLPCVL